MNGVSISPSLTLATRVCIAILKVISKAIRTELTGHYTWVIQHAARPVLKVEIALDDNRKAENSYGFAQAITFFIKELPFWTLSDQDLFEAYRIAGTRFGPELSHVFVLLNYNSALSMAKQRMKKGPKKQHQTTTKYEEQASKKKNKQGTSKQGRGKQSNTKPGTSQGT